MSYKGEQRKGRKCVDKEEQRRNKRRTERSKEEGEKIRKIVCVAKEKQRRNKEKWSGVTQKGRR